MLVVYIGLASIVLSGVLLWALGKYSNRDKAATVDVSVRLRQLLLDRAEGRITPEEFEQHQAQLYASVLENPQGSNAQFKRWVLPVVGVVIVVGAAVYLLRGGDKLPAPEQAMKFPAAEQKSQANSGGDLNTVVKRLADKMAADPKNGEGWLLLAKTYIELRRYPEADDAFSKAAALLPADAGMLADWADAHVMAKDRKWDAEGRQIVKRALAADAKHVKTLALAGSESFDRGDYKGAIEFWKRMKAAAPADSMDAKLADANIAEANAMLSGKKTPVADAASAPAVLGGVVTLSPKLKGKVAANDTLFVIAKAADGAGAPLAVGRYKGNDFPIEFKLDDSMAVIPGRTLSQHAEVMVSARISKSGNAEAAKGDLVTTPVKARLGNTTLALELNTER